MNPESAILIYNQPNRISAFFLERKDKSTLWNTRGTLVIYQDGSGPNPSKKLFGTDELTDEKEKYITLEQAKIQLPKILKKAKETAEDTLFLTDNYPLRLELRNKYNPDELDRQGFKERNLTLSDEIINKIVDEFRSTGEFNTAARSWGDFWNKLHQESPLAV